jgi:hypothetical protein
MVKPVPPPIAVEAARLRAIEIPLPTLCPTRDASVGAVA